MPVAKLLLLVCVCCINTLSVFSQKKSVEEFWPKKNFAVGMGAGTIVISGDVSTEKFSLQQTVEIRKQFLKWFAIRANYTYGKAKGINWLAAENFAKNTAWSAKYAAPVRMPNGSIQYGYNSNGTFTSAASADRVYYNYQTAVNMLSASAQFTLPIPFKAPRFGISALLGAGALFYKSRVNALNSNGASYTELFNKTALSTQLGKKETINALKAVMDKSYETNAEDYSKQPRHLRHIGLGACYRLNKKLENVLERTIIFTKSDLLDGQRWQEHAYGDAVLTRDYDMIVTNNLCLRYYFK